LEVIYLEFRWSFVGKNSLGEKIKVRNPSRIDLKVPPGSLFGVGGGLVLVTLFKPLVGPLIHFLVFFETKKSRLQHRLSFLIT
jgi:hypothetical protein